MPDALSEHDSYEVRWGVGSLVPLSIIIMVIGAALVASWSFGAGAILTLGGFLAVLIGLSIGTYRRVLTREVAFGVSAEGIFLGRGADGGPPQRVPWHVFDGVAHYHRASRSEGESRTLKYIGLVSGRRIVAERRTSGWRFNIEELTSAVGRHGRGHRIEVLPKDRQPAGDILP